MNQKFSSLKLGVWFYPIKSNGSINTQIILQKIDELQLETIDNLHLTPNAMKHKRFNAIIINSSKENDIKGFLDYLPPEILVLNCEHTC